MQARNTISITIPLALLAALSLAGCGEVVAGPADAPESASAADTEDALDEESGSEEAADYEEAADEADVGEEDEGDEEAKVGKVKEGSRDLMVIANMVKERRQPVRECYKKALKKHPGLKGKLVIHFELDPEGNVTSAKLNEERSKIKVQEVVDCAIKVIRAIKFPASPKGMVTEVNYPYDLNPPR